MDGGDLFAAEAEALHRANAVLADPASEPASHRAALEELVQHYGQLMRQSRRLISRSDRTERELNLLNARLKQLSDELDYKARHDNLTGALNRGAVFEQAHQILQQSPMSLIVLDIDFFKRINDEFGHPAGDAVIRELVARLRTTLAGNGVIGRVGGEEFTILLSGVALEQAVILAGRIRQAIAGDRDGAGAGQVGGIGRPVSFLHSVARHRRYQRGQRARVHLAHDLLAMGLHGPFRGPQFGGYLLVQPSFYQTFQHFAFAPGQGLESLVVLLPLLHLRARFIEGHQRPAEGFHQLLAHHRLGAGIAGRNAHEALAGVVRTVALVLRGGGRRCAGDDDQWPAQFTFIQQRAQTWRVEVLHVDFQNQAATRGAGGVLQELVGRGVMGDMESGGFQQPDQRSAVRIFTTDDMSEMCSCHVFLP